VTNPRRVLFVDDDVAMGDAVRDTLKRVGFEVTPCDSAERALSLLAQTEFEVVVTDLQMPQMEGLEFCKRIVRTWAELPVIVVTAFGTTQTAIAAMRAGAHDFIEKPLQIDELSLRLARAVEHKQLKHENRRLRETVGASQAPARMIGDSAAMRAVYSMLARVKASDATILILGESGTGKELVARAVHEDSARRSGPFVAVNCAAVPEGLIESELFGHHRGAFTDAHSARTGLFMQANGGTLFLDEIGDLPLAMQVKLLRALQERTVRPVGGDRELAFDARIVAATNRDLETEVAERRFREDLYYRIHVLRIDMPPLRARGSDILRIAEHYVHQFAERANKAVTGISAPVTRKLLEYPWPGNVRELQNCMERAVTLTSFEELTLEDLPDNVMNYAKTQFVVPVDNPTELLPLAQIEKRYILEVLRSVQGQKSLAAKVLGVNRRTLHRKLKDYGWS
jgi:two-component system response regulator AtoC